MTPRPSTVPKPALAVGLLAAAVTPWALPAGAGSAPAPHPDDLSDLPPCKGQSPYRVIAPAELPNRYQSGVALVWRREPTGTVRPAQGSIRVAVEPPPGGRLRRAYSGSTEKTESGKYYTTFPVRFLPGDTGARVTIAFDEGYGSGRDSCVRRFVRDIVAMPDRGVRVRVSSVRATARTVTIAGRITGRTSGRPGLVQVRVVSHPGPYAALYRLRVKGGRFTRTVRNRVPHFTSVLRIERRGYWPGEFRDPAPTFGF